MRFGRFLDFAKNGLLALLLAGAAVTNVHAQKIALFAPLSGDYAELGEKFQTGAKLALAEAAGGIELIIVDDGCDPDLAISAYHSLPLEDIDLIGGFLCNDPAIAVATQSVGTDIPVIISGASSLRLIKDRKREQWNLWRAAPGDDYPVEIAAKAILKSWREKPYAIVDDGTIYGRSFTDTLRLKMNELGLAPQFSDTFRAAQSTQAGLIRRLERSGVTAAFIASSSTEDLFTIARDLNKLGVELELITTEAMMVLPYFLKSITKMVGMPMLMEIKCHSI